MSQTQGLLDFNAEPPPGPYAPHYRATDPETSRKAAAKHQASGKLSRNCTIVLAALQKHPRSTYAELFAVLSSSERETIPDNKEVLRRLNDLRSRGLARNPTVAGEIEKRACRVNGSTMQTWEATV
ncbi:MAG TPA: hypothetical protein VFE62_20875 [Gemmataceae bacterium]|nr:hypothetical protein [Gemmataceae bacterium]